MADRASRKKGAVKAKESPAAGSPPGNGSMDSVVRTIAEKRNQLQDERAKLEGQRDELEHRITAVHAQELALDKAIEALQGNA